MRLLGGIELQVAESGADAIGLLQAWTPQVLVLDANLPDMNGHELLQRRASRRTGRRAGLHVLGRRDAGGSGARPRPPAVPETAGPADPEIGKVSAAIAALRG